MLRIAICDDDTEELLNIEKIIQGFKAMHSEIDVIFEVFTTGIDLIAAMEKKITFDIILLDIIMPVLNGIETAQEIRRKNNAAKIIFLTSTPEFAVDSYNVDAFYYVLKPILEARLISILDKALSNISKQRRNILLKTKIGVSKIYLDDIEYLEIIGRTIYYHLRNGTITECMGVISQLEGDLLIYRQFIKTHRSFIANMDFIDTISAYEIKSLSGARIPISRANYQKVKKEYIDYSFEVGASIT